MHTTSSLPFEHFKLAIHATVAHVIGQAMLAFDSAAALFEHFPFLEAYYGELVALGAEEDEPADWQARLAAWELPIAGHLPLRSLQHALALDFETMTLLLCTGLVEEDPRFGLLFEAMQPLPGQHRPTLGLLSAWWRDPESWSGVRSALRKLMEAGLLHVLNPEAPRSEWAVQPPALLWDALRGDLHSAHEGRRVVAPWLVFHPQATLVAADALIAPPAVEQAVANLTKVLAAGEAGAVVVRGPRANGRRTVLGALARALGLGTLEVSGLPRLDDERWRLAGPLATMLHALPVLVADLGPGDTLDVPALSGYDGPLGVVLGSQGGVKGPGVERALTVTLPMPDPELRRRHWADALATGATQRLSLVAPSSSRTNGHGHSTPALSPGHSTNGHGPGSGTLRAAPAAGPEMIGVLADRFRMTGGNIRRAARLAHAQAALAGRSDITLADAQQAAWLLNRQALDALATHVPALDDGDAWHFLAAGADTLSELRTLESRCRHRERLRQAVGPALGGQLNSGVRALFAGPSGTGKTLAGRVLASTLGMDLYRLDLSTVVNKYIGETEKNLNQVFSHAEELDVILLLDEGDALLTQRTGVSNANDRYANLETNFLLQRIESYEGILIVTTNAGERIDGAFQRRMDVVVEFRAPEPAERQAIWRLHLPGRHAVDEDFLEEVSARCALTGGQIRNAALHAALLALRAGRPVNSEHVFEGVQREYRKAGGVCPLRRMSATSRELTG